MKQELEKQLQDKFPKQFRDLYGHKAETCMAWGLTCGEGWFPIIEQACTKIQEVLDKHPDMDFKWLQIKEKFGQLTLYGGFTNEEGMPNEICDIIKETQKDSLKVCEICGTREGEITTKGIWIRTLCNGCRY
jgi:hypothetical protein